MAVNNVGRSVMVGQQWREGGPLLPRRRPPSVKEPRDTRPDPCDPEDLSELKEPEFAPWLTSSSSLITPNIRVSKDISVQLFSQ
jgi:hypothetical protein